MKKDRNTTKGDKMSSKHENPYNEGKHYGKLFAVWRNRQVVTRDELVAEAIKLGISNEVTKGSKTTITPAMAMVTVLLSPRHPDAVRKGADCRGNASAAGEHYYAEKLDGKKYRLRWREVPLEPRARNMKGANGAVKAKASQKTPAKKTVKKTDSVETPAPVMPEVPVETPADATA